MNNNYALVIGGTGMLQGVCHWLAENHYFTSVICRDLHRFEQMKKNSSTPERFHSLIVDYHDERLLREKLNDAIQQFGAPKLVVCWIHSSAKSALSILKDELQGHTPWTLFHIQGSSRFFEKENTSVPTNCVYRRVYLGFVLENNVSRWLTHAEIANGVIAAIQTDNEETIVGTLEPWEMRP